MADSLSSHSTEKDVESLTDRPTGEGIVEVDESVQDDGRRAVGPTDENPVPTEKPSVHDIQSVPNGGFVAWTQVLASFFLFFNSYGILTAFGAYQTFYETGDLFSSSPANISWIGSVESCFLLLVGTLTGPLYDRGYMRQIVAFGSILLVFSQMMLSLCTEYWQVFLAQGLGVGLGAGCLFLPSVAILSTYFTSHLGAATGLAATGSGIGGVIYPIVFRQLQRSLGFPWATRVIGFMMLGTLLISNSIYRVRVKPGKIRKLWDLAAFRSLPYLFVTIAETLMFTGLYTPFFYIQSFAVVKRITGADLGFYLLSIINAAGIIGRILVNRLADKTGPLSMVAPVALMMGVLAFCLIPVRSPAALIVLAALYGFFAGPLSSLAPPSVVAVTKNRALIGTWMGQTIGVMSIGALLGPPVAGWILVASDFTCVWIWTGVTLVVGAGFVGASRVALVGCTLRKRA